MNENDSDPESNIYVYIIEETLRNLLFNCNADEERALELLRKLWKSKMQHVILGTIETSIEESKLSSKKPRRKSVPKPNGNTQQQTPTGKNTSPAGKTRRESIVTNNGNSKSTRQRAAKSKQRLQKMDCNVVSCKKEDSPPTSPGTNMPCLHCDKVTETCIHLSPSYRENNVQCRYRYTPLEFSKVKLIRCPINCKKKIAKPVKIALPVRQKKLKENRICKLHVPLLLRPYLKSILGPMVSRVCQYSTRRAAAMLQRFLNTYNEITISQVDGASDVSFKICMNGRKFVSLSVTNLNLDRTDLDSDDDVTDDEDSSVECTTDNIVTCQFTNIDRKHRNGWKFQLKNGVMHISGKEYVFQEAECVAKF